MLRYTKVLLERCESGRIGVGAGSKSVPPRLLQAGSSAIAACELWRFGLIDVARP